MDQRKIVDKLTHLAIRTIPQPVVKLLAKRLHFLLMSLPKMNRTKPMFLSCTYIEKGSVYSALYCTLLVGSLEEKNKL